MVLQIMQPSIFNLLTDVEHNIYGHMIELLFHSSIDHIRS